MGTRPIPFCDFAIVTAPDNYFSLTFGLKTLAGICGMGDSLRRRPVELRQLLLQ